MGESDKYDNGSETLKNKCRESEKHIKEGKLI